MFERFTKSARGAVEGAVAQAERMGAKSVAEEHLLLALLDQEGTRTSFAFATLGIAGPRREALTEALADARRRGGLTKADREALAGIGIDVTEIVSKVEQAHGVGAMAPAAGPPNRRGLLSGHRTFTRPAKDVLEGALRIALGRGDRCIGDEHVLLALIVQPGVVADVLAESGLTYAAAERALFGGAAA